MAGWKFGSMGIGSSMRSAWRRPRGTFAARLRHSTDLLVAASLALLGALLASTLSPGNPLRMYATLAILLTVPGYLLLQAFVVPAGPIPSRALHALVGVGLSPVVVGLLALSTAFMLGGIAATTIIVTVTGACWALAFIAFARRPVAPAAPDGRPVLA